MDAVGVSVGEVLINSRVHQRRHSVDIQLLLFGTHCVPISSVPRTVLFRRFGRIRRWNGRWISGRIHGGSLCGISGWIGDRQQSTANSIRPLVGIVVLLDIALTVGFRIQRGFLEFAVFLFRYFSKHKLYEVVVDSIIKEMVSCFYNASEIIIRSTDLYGESQYPFSMSALLSLLEHRYDARKQWRGRSWIDLAMHKKAEHR